MKVGMMEYWNVAARDDLFSFKNPLFQYSNIDDLVKSLLDRHPGENRGPEYLEITGFRLSPE